ncbi:MAG TPA: tyrosine-type recombinase/integrase [Clostridiaceae bacterium]|nr:tyrosine-type recombinase/integrase [Clostridiaceae bacterium]
MQRYSIFLETLDEYLNCYITMQKGLSKNTQRSYKYTFQLLLEFFYRIHRRSSDTLLFSDLTYENLTGFLDWIEGTRKCSVSTRNQRLAALKSFSTYAQLRNIDASTVFRNSILKIPTKKTSYKELSFFTFDEVRFLLEAVEDSTIGRRNKALLAFMYASGARAQEVCDVRIRDITFTTPYATVILYGKGNKNRRISIPKRPTQILLNYLKDIGKYGKADEYVFSSQINNHMSIACIEEIFKKYIAIARKQHPEYFTGKYSPHTMRHTTATHMVEAGISLLIIKNFLGHSSIETTQIYAKVTEQHIQSHISKWNTQWIHTDTSKTKDHDNCPEFLKLK